MGGGRRKIREARKSANLDLRVKRSGATGEGSGGGGGGEVDLTEQLCRRSRALAFRVEPGVTFSAGEAVRVARGNPPALVAGAKTIGWLSDPRQEQTIAACIEAGYQLTGQVEAVDADLGEGLASVSGFKT
jgi:hypothetical protein